MDPFIIFGGTVFWALTIVFFVALLAAVELDSGWFASGITAAILITLTFAVGVDVFSLVWNNPISAITYFVSYFIAGTVWAVAKWWFYCRKLLDVVKNVKIYFLNKNNISGTVVPENYRDKFVEAILHSEYYNDRHFPPQAMNHKSDWLMWATWWPVSFFWTMLNQPIKKVWLFIYSCLGGMMQKISNSVFKGI